MADAACRLATDSLTATYGTFAAVKNVSLDFAANQVHALIGPSAAASPPSCGPSTASTS